MIKNIFRIIFTILRQLVLKVKFSKTGDYSWLTTYTMMINVFIIFRFMDLLSLNDKNYFIFP